MLYRASSGRVIITINLEGGGSKEDKGSIERDALQFGGWITDISEENAASICMVLPFTIF